MLLRLTPKGVLLMQDDKWILQILGFVTAFVELMRAFTDFGVAMINATLLLMGLFTGTIG